MVSAKKLLNAKVDLPFDDYYAYFCTYAFQPSQMCIGMKTYHFQASPVTLGPNLYPDPLGLSPLYVIVRPRKFH